MRGHVRRRGGRWELVVELGEQPAQECVACGKRSWLEGKPLEKCECGGELEEVRRRRQYTKGGFRLKKDALAALEKQLVARREGSYMEPSNMTVAEFLVRRWLPDIEGTLRPSTFESYRQHVHAYFVPYLGTLRLRLLDPGHINAMYRELATTGGRKGTGLAPRTRRRIHTTLRRALRDAVKWRLVARNAAADADPPKVGGLHREMDVWSRDELRLFLGHVAEDRLFAMWRLFATTGMRRGEVCGLQWRDVDFERSRVTVRQARVNVAYKVVVGPVKSDKPRVLPLDAETMGALKTWRDSQADELLELCVAQSPEHYLFTDKVGEPLHPDRVTKLFDEHQAAIRAEQVKRHHEAGGQGDAPQLPRIRLHDLRHTYATLGLRAGVPVKVMSERLGHADPTITLQVYQHVLPDMQESAAELLASMIDVA